MRLPREASPKIIACTQMVSGLAITHVPLALMLQDSLMTDSTDFHTGGNENAASIIQCVGMEDMRQVNSERRCRQKPRRGSGCSLAVVEGERR